MTTHKTVPTTEYLPQPEAESFHYYDTHPTKDDLMGESAAQSHVILYLLNVLQWLYHAKACFIVSNLNIYRERKRNENPIAPDVAVFKDVIIPNIADRQLRSWRLYEPDRPAPQVVFEISSEKTWQADLNHKPAAYAALGAQEYYAYEPNDPPYWPQSSSRLRGWQRENGTLVERSADARGWIWSDELASWLAADGALLRLYNQAGQLRLTEGEAERAAKETERAAKEVERAAKEAERTAKEAAWAKLRELGIDPEQLR